MFSTTHARLGTVAVALALTVAVAACGDDGVEAPTTEVPTTEVPTTNPGTQAPAIANGRWTAYVTVGEDENGAVTLGIDLADLLTGEAARQAAIDAGLIEEGEDLPNDMFIDNPEQVLELLHLVPDAEISVVSGSEPGGSIIVDEVTFVALYEGTYTGEPVYGFPPHEPILMEVTVLDGLVTAASAIYLP